MDKKVNYPNLNMEKASIKRQWYAVSSGPVTMSSLWRWARFAHPQQGQDRPEMALERQVGQVKENMSATSMKTSQDLKRD